MATNFPSGLDAFTNPSSSDTLDNPPHDQQHADVNDAVEAIETALLDGAPLHIDDANERVGIGTSSPSFPLSVDIDAPATYGNAAGNFAQMWTNSGTNALGVSLGDNLGAGLITNNGYDLHLGTSGTSRVTVQSGGNVGINDTTPSYTLDVNGDINATGDLRIGGTAIGTWTTYTPALTAATTNPTLGTGSTAHGVYTKINDLVIGNAYFAFGSSGASAGTGNYSLSLPVAADTTSNNNIIAGHAWLFDSSVTTARHAALQVVTSTTAFMLLTDNASFVAADNVPFVWTNNDQIRFQFIYKAA